MSMRSSLVEQTTMDTHAIANFGPSFPPSPTFATVCPCEREALLFTMEPSKVVPPRDLQSRIYELSWALQTNSWWYEKQGGRTSTVGGCPEAMWAFPTLISQWKGDTNLLCIITLQANNAIASWTQWKEARATWKLTSCDPNGGDWAWQETNRFSLLTFIHEQSPGHYVDNTRDN